MTPEGTVKVGCKRVLKADGTWFYMPMQNGMGTVGIPDIIGCRPTVITQDMVGQTFGRFLGVECKAPGKIKDTTANQDHVISEIKNHGGMAIVVDSAVGLETFLKENP